MVKRITLVLCAMGSSLLASGCVQDLWAAYIKGAGNYVTATTAALLEQYLPF